MAPRPANRSPSCPSLIPTRGESGLTLIELLVVMAVLATLASLMVPVYVIVQKAMKRSATDMVLKRTDTALRMFRIDWGVYPTQDTYPEPFDGRNFPNRLYYHIGTNISWTPDASGTSPAERVQRDMDTAERKYDDANPTPLTFVRNDFTSGDSNRKDRHAARVNRMAREQMRLAVLAGNLSLRGQVITNPAGATVSDRRATPILASGEALSAAGPGSGWAKDYLEGDLEARYRSGDAILDSWRNPLIYVCQVIPGVKATMVGFDSLVMNQHYGLGAIGFDPTTGPAPAIVAAGRARLLYSGRIRLSLSDAGDGQPTPTNATWFPQAGNLMHADLRWYCPPGQETEFELWSAGPDRAFAYMRDDPANTDNLSAVRAQRELKP